MVYFSVAGEEESEILLAGIGAHSDVRHDDVAQLQAGYIPLNCLWI